MGVLVELLSPASSLTTLTDLQGHFWFRDVVPGIYQLSASATLFLPSSHKQLQLQPRVVSVINLTLNTLFNESTWISSRPDRLSQQDDWSWTLRSPANRPMLRMVDDEADEKSREQRASAGKTRVATTVGDARGMFGTSGVRESVEVAHLSRNQRVVTSARSEILQVPNSSSAPAISVLTSMRREGVGLTKSAVAVRFQTFPQVLSADASGFRVVGFSSAERIEVGEFAAVEVGSDMRMISAGGRSNVISRPFLNVETRPFAGWSATYALAGSPDFARFGDVGEDVSPAPAVVTERTGLLTERGLHQQISGRRTMKHAVVSLDYHHDIAQKALLRGQLVALSHNSGSSGRPPAAASLSAFAYDTSNGVVCAFAPGYSADGFDVGVDIATGHGLSVSGTYLVGGAVYLPPPLVRGGEAAVSVKQSQALLTIVQGKFARSGTKFSASYRWQPSRTMTVISPYTAAGTEPYLGFHLRQSLPLRRLGYHYVEISVDADNLLGEGYRSYTLAGQPAILASALRDMRTGLTFSY